MNTKAKDQKFQDNVVDQKNRLPGQEPKADVPPAATENISVDPQTGETKAPPGMENIGLLKKIVAKDIVPRKLMVYKKEKTGETASGTAIYEVTDGAPRPLYTVFGIANQKTEKGDSTYGPWLAFTGSFEAVRLSDGMRFKSDKLFLQDPAEGLLLSALTEAGKSDAGATIGFAFEVGVKVSQRWIDTDQGNSYEYTIISKIDSRQNDPLALMRAQIAPTLQLTGAK